MKTFTFSILFSIFCFPLFAQESLTIDVKEPGTLEALIGETKYTLSELTLKGEISVSDFDIIHQCASRGILEKIDFSEVKLPNNEIPDLAFLKTESGQAWSLALKSVILPKSVERIGVAAFCGCYFMESIQMPETLLVLEDDAFYECRNLRNIIIPSGVTELKKTTFYQCENLESVQLPEGLTKIGYAVFNACHKLNNVDLPESLEAIGNLAFNINFALEAVTIPQNVKDIGEYAFSNCNNLKSINLLSSDLKEIKNGTFQWLPILEKIDVPEGVERIGQNAFLWAFELAHVTFPASLEYIGEGAFEAASLDTIVFPAGLSFIGAAAFNACTNLKCIYSMNPIPPQLGDLIPPFYEYPAFNEVDKSVCTLYVPIGSSILYRNAEGWKEFSKIEETADFPTSLYLNEKDVDLNKTKVYTQNGNIVVESEEYGIPVCLFDMQGNVVSTKVMTDDLITFSPSNGLYLVKVGGKSYKIMFWK